MTGKTRDAILQFTEAQGTDEELLNWFDVNKDRLVFDKERKKFMTPLQNEAGSTNAPPTETQIQP
ncbi:MAG: hypothetical protein HY360_12040 [Verrucomicrobia bacterium]|nr:hypothetical protein [Verrucomicrobiota bacterium]